MGSVDVAKTAIVVDDHEISRRLMRAMLQREGFDVLEVDNAPEAAALCQSRKIRLLVAEISLPGLPGSKAAARVSNAGLPMLFVSAGPLHEHREAVADLSASRVGFLEKPFSAASFSKAVQAVLRTEL